MLGAVRGLPQTMPFDHDHRSLPSSRDVPLVLAAHRRAALRVGSPGRLARTCPVRCAVAAQPEHRGHRIVTYGPRLELVDQAIAYWNEQLQEVGSAFRLGKAERLIQPPPDAALQEQSRMILDPTARALNVPQVLRELPGDLRVVLGDAPFVSHAGPFDEKRRRVVGIRSANVPPLSLPNVAVNLIAHELGHAIGIPHNADPTALMCGRPAECRPDIYQSATPRMFPLLAAERTMLLRLYPADWRPVGE